MWNINAPQRRIPCVIFTKFTEFVPVSVALAVTVSLDLLKCLWSYGDFKLTGSGYPKFSAPLASKLRVIPPKVLAVQERARGPLSLCQVGRVRI